MRQTETRAAAASLSGADAAYAEQLKAFAKTYIWWKTPEEAVLYPHLVIARVMDIGTWEDVTLLMEMIPEHGLRERLREAEAGQFRPQSWSYWHYKLGVVERGADVPPLPKRRFPESHRVPTVSAIAS